MIMKPTLAFTTTAGESKPVIEPKEALAHTFLLGVCSATDGEYVLSEVMPRVRIIGITQAYHGLQLLMPLPGSQEEVRSVSA